MARRPSKSGTRGARQRRFLGLLAVIVLGAWLLRLGVSSQLLAHYAPVTDPSPASDMYTYRELARAIASGSYDYARGFYYQPLYYAAFLPTVYRLTSDGPWGVIWAQSILGALTVLFVGLAFARLFGRWPGVLGALLLALCRTHIFYTPFLLNEVLQGFLLALGVWLTVLAAQRRAWWWWAAAGLAYGLGNATRGNVVLLLPLVLLLVAWQWRRQPLRLTLLAALVAVTFYLPQLPFAMANYRALGRWVGPSSAAGAVLALGNTPEAPPGGRDPDAGAGAMEYPASWAEWMRQEALPPPQRVTVGTQIWRWVRQEPLAWAELKWRMWLLFWHRSEIPNNVAMTSFGERVQAPLLWLPVLTEFVLLGSLGLAGLLLALGRGRRRPLVWYAAGTVLLYAGSIVVFYILARFRLPVVPLLAGFGGYALWRCARAWRTYRRTRRQRPLRLATLVYLGSLVFVALGYDFYRYGAEATVLRLVRPHGVWVELERSWLVKDHGPLTLGGWLPVPVRDAPQLTKSLRLPDLPGATPAAVRVAVNSQGPADLDLRLNDQPWQRFTVQRGLQWIELRGLTAATAGRFTVQAHCEVPTVWFMVDAQRRYGRSQLVVRDQPSPPGEWVVELHLEKPSVSPSPSPSSPPQEPPHE